MIGALSHITMILRKPRFDETCKKLNGTCCGAFPFTTCHSSLTIHTVSTNQNLKRVGLFLGPDTVTESNIRSRSFSFLLLLQKFKSMLSTNSSTTHQSLHTTCPESSCSCFSRLVGFFGFILAVVISSTYGSFIRRSPSRHLHAALHLA